MCVRIDTSFSSSAALAGSMGGLFTDGEESATANPAEDISKWSVEDVCGFISSLAGCAEYTQVRTERERERRGDAGLRGGWLVNHR